MRNIEIIRIEHKQCQHELEILQDRFDKLCIEKFVVENGLVIGDLYEYMGQRCILDCVKKEGTYSVYPYVRKINKDGKPSKNITCAYFEEKLKHVGKYTGD